MPPTLLFPLNEIETRAVKYGADVIESINPHRGDMRLIDEVTWESEDRSAVVAIKHVRADEFWCAGHIPGRPLFPGVLQIEAAAQASSFVVLRREQDQEFMGFVACDGFKFRGQVTPGDRLVIVAQQVDFRRRRQMCLTQGLVNDQIVFEGQITGMPL